MNRAEVIGFYGSLMNEEVHKFEDDGNEQCDSVKPSISVTRTRATLVGAKFGSKRMACECDQRAPR